MANTDQNTGTHAQKDTEVASVADRVTEVAVTARNEVLRRADDATQAASETLEERPFGALAGAIAIGAALAALIPATERELTALGPVGRRLRDAAEEAFQAARHAGMAELSAAGLTLAAASDGAGGIVGKLAKAATAAANAAISKPSAETAGAAATTAPAPAANASVPAPTVAADRGTQPAPGGGYSPATAAV